MVLQPRHGLHQGQPPHQPVVVLVEPAPETHGHIGQGLDVHGVDIVQKMDVDVAQNIRAEGDIKLPQRHVDEAQLVVRNVRHVFMDQVKQVLKLPVLS